MNTTCPRCGYALTIVVPAQAQARTFLQDMQRTGVCPRCGSPLFRSRVSSAPPVPLSQRTTLRAVRGLLRLALRHLDQALGEEP